MSPIDLLRDEPLILASLLVPVLPLLIAVGIMVSIGMRDILRRQRLSSAELEHIDAVASPASANDLLLGVEEDDLADQADEEEDEDDETDGQDETVENDGDDSMNDLLSSVFQEEVDLGHYDVLLFGLEPVGMEELAEALRLTHQQLTGKERPS